MHNPNKANWKQYVESISVPRLERIIRHLWDHCTRYDGYQPFGYDRRTLMITKPGFLEALDFLLAGYRQKENLK